MQTLNQKMKPIAAAVGTAFVATLATACSTDTASDTAVAAQELAEGYDVAVKAEAEGKCGEGKCGEGKCGGDKAEGEGKCGEGKCGEGKCGGDKA